jgi:hypothetical protein
MCCEHGFLCLKGTKSTVIVQATMYSFFASMWLQLNVSVFNIYNIVVGHGVGDFKGVTGRHTW